jgi:hypothetical protein
MRWPLIVSWSLIGGAALYFGLPFLELVTR